MKRHQSLTTGARPAHLVIGVLFLWLSQGCTSYHIIPQSVADEVIVNNESQGKISAEGMTIETTGYGDGPQVCFKRSGKDDVAIQPPLTRRSGLLLSAVGTMTVLTVPMLMALAFAIANPTLVPGVISESPNYARVVLESPTWATVPALVAAAGIGMAPLILAMGPDAPAEKVSEAFAERLSAEETVAACQSETSTLESGESEEEQS